MFVALLLAISVSLYPDAVNFGIESGIPLGDWSSELKTANSVYAGYDRMLLTGLDLTVAVEALSYRTVADLYHVNMLHIPLGLSYSFIRRGAWSMDISPSVGMTVIEREYDEASELGINEFCSLRFGASFKINEEIKITGYAKYLQERFVNGKSYIGIGIAFAFSV